MDNHLVELIPASGIIATYDREKILAKTINSLALQSVQPKELIIIDSSEDSNSKDLVESIPWLPIKSTIIYIRTKSRGAALQRIQGVMLSTQPFIFFMDDDIIFYENCIERLWLLISADNKIGGVNAMIINQRYHPPGFITRFMYRILSGKNLSSYAGKCIGPAWNILPDDSDHLPSEVKVDWLNTTCTLYRKSALPNPIFDPHFTGYSLMEDLALSLQVGKNWVLYNRRDARIYHDSQPGVHKNKVSEISRMELVNRYFVMVKILNAKSVLDHLKFLFFQFFQIISVLNTKKGWTKFHLILKGKIIGLWQISTKKF